MKKLKIFFAALIISVAGFSQSCPVPESLDILETLGVWKGSYTLNGEFIDFTFSISQVDGLLKSTVDIPKLKLGSIAYDIRICEGQELHLKNIAASSSVEFIGKPKANSINGRVTFKQNDQVFSEEVFTAKRAIKKASSN